MVSCATAQAGRAQKEGASVGGAETVEQQPSGCATATQTINPKGSVPESPRLTCEKAQAIVATYGFREIKARICAGKVLGFTASRDGKPFAIQIVAASGELAKVRRLR
jgi:hypothetical protein